MQRRTGFTLIELLIVVVIIGILAGIAIPKFSSSREKAWITQLKSDLRNLATAQETYFQDYQTYATVTAAGLTSASGLSTWKPSTGTKVIAAGTNGNTTGWNAQLSHPGTTQTCSLFQGVGGTGAFAGSGQAEGDVTCY
ncbi:MAG: prepilin-type N-terminal cleavage/methylation domain-containing protein [Gemmatimonadetes bacterium]|nr:prepilin-type N-terminal cleavage/methylation domain-containing protein [Gemmatimonadota bacterium]